MDKGNKRMSHNKVVQIAIIGINGYGVNHLKQTLALAELGFVELAAVSDLKIAAEQEVELKARGTRLYSDYKAMLATERTVDLVIVSTPIHLHVSMGIDVMEAGFDLLLEKPPAAVIEDVDRLIEASKRTGQRCAVNFSSLTPDGRSLINEWVEQGRIGEVIAIKGLGLWQRTESYYNRTPWAGKLTVNGHHVLDGTVMNPFAHLLQMVVQIAALPAMSGGLPNVPEQVQAELYRANPIESEDTSSIRVKMSAGPSAYFYATVCTNNPVSSPQVIVQGSKGTIQCDYIQRMTLTTEEETITYENPEKWPVSSNLMNFVRVLRGEEKELNSPLAKVRPYMLAANGAFESAAPIQPVPAEYVNTYTVHNGQISHCITNIDVQLRQAFDRNELLSEIGVPWAEASAPFQVTEYRKFNAPL